MLTAEQGLTPVDGFNVYDVMVVTQMIEKLLRGGLITGQELATVSTLRGKAVVLVARVGIDLDNQSSIEENGDGK